MHGEMDSSSAHSHHQEIGSETLESMLVCTKSQQDKKARPSDMQSLKCPRCDSANTKFCYYNNYSLSQPRYFCKSCRRYWTKGGTLRNVPVGGGCRKNKRSSSSSASASSSSSSKHHPVPAHIQSFNPYESDALSLAIARLQKQSSGPDDHVWPSPNQTHYHGEGNFGPGSGLFDAIRNGFLENPAQGLYYGSEMGMGMSGAQEVGIPFEDFSISGGGNGNGTAVSTAVTTVKQEMCGGGREGEGRVLWGFPWQGAGGGDGNQAAGFDSGRGSWNGLGPSGWHGLLNSPLM